MRVTVPAGWKPGQKVKVMIAGDRRTILVEPPAGAVPGETILEFPVPHAGQ